MKKNIPLTGGWQLNTPEDDGWFDISDMPRQVHEILYEKGVISGDFEIGLGEDSKWVAERDWTYRCFFPCAETSGRAWLWFGCLDTLAEIYLNGEHIASSQSLYLPLRVEVTGKLRTQVNLCAQGNLLELHFRSPYRYLAEHPLPPEWEGKFLHPKILRKPLCDFTSYLGAQPYLTPMGVAGEVRLELVDRAELVQCDVEATLDEGMTRGAVRVAVTATEAPGLRGEVTVTGPDGGVIGTGAAELTGGRGDCTVDVAAPALWWPVGYGEQPLYRVDITLRCGGEAADTCVKEVGFRTLAMNENFDLRVNGKKVRLWGSNIPPLDGRTHRWNPERAAALLDFAALANMNTLRIWGEGEPLDDEFYAMCDRRGILLWHEFYHYYGMQPDTKEYFDLCLRETAYHVNRLKHHPSIFMWCGGNEGLMGGEYDLPGVAPIGSGIYTLYGELLKELDPGRYYHLNSPYGGAYANDPTAGDSHGYEMWWYVPGMEYPVAFTEHMRVSGAQVKSLRRFIPEAELWPEGFVNASYHADKNAKMLPEAWAYRTGGMLDRKCGPIHLFRDADSPEELSYRYAAAHALSFKQGIARSRMGRPSGSAGPRISNCHLIWKLSDTWPLLYSAIIDYYLEPYMPYYAAKRGYAPVAVCFDIRDHIHVWLVNDSPSDVEGTLEYGVFSPVSNSFTALERIPAAMAAGESGEAACLDSFGQFRSDSVLYARFVDEKRGVDYTVHDLVDIERRLVFPDAVLELAVSGDVLTVRTDRFAHCVELSGNEDGDEFGFYFEDNFFDLLPGQEKRVRILGRHRRGTISAKAHYANETATLVWENGK